MPSAQKLDLFAREKKSRGVFWPVQVMKLIAYLTRLNKLRLIPQAA